MFDVYINDRRDHLLIVAKGQPIPIHANSGRWRKTKAAAAVSDEIKSAVQTSGYYWRELGKHQKSDWRMRLQHWPLVMLLLFTATGVALPNDLIGQASIIDGDTLEIHGSRIRLWGIDAPESTQLCRGEDSEPYRCGAKAANDLDAFIARRPVSCAPVSLDQYRRMVATCSVAGVDLGDWLVRNGFALDWPQYSKGRYGAAQRDAERAGRGIWAGSYMAPWLYRACIRQGGTPGRCSDDATAHP